MELEHLKYILEHSCVATLKDDNGWNVAAIAFLSVEDARAIHNLLWNLKRLMEQFPNTKI